MGEKAGKYFCRQFKCEETESLVRLFCRVRRPVEDSETVKWKLTVILLVTAEEHNCRHFKRHFKMPLGMALKL